MQKRNSQKVQGIKIVVCTHAMISYLLLIANRFLVLNDQQAATEPQFESEIH